MRAHVIENGRIVNTIEVASLNALPGRTLVEAVTGSIGDIYDPGTGEVTPPPAPETPVPISVSMFQARTALKRAGLLAAIDAAVAAMDGEADIAWAYAYEVRRDSNLVNQIGAGLGLTSEQMDDLFRTAATIVA